MCGWGEVGVGLWKGLRGGTGSREYGRVLPGYGVERKLSAVTWTLAWELSICCQCQLYFLLLCPSQKQHLNLSPEVLSPQLWEPTDLDSWEACGETQMWPWEATLLKGWGHLVGSPCLARTW